MVGIQIIVDFDTVFRQQRMVYSVLDKVIQYFETAMVKVGNHILFHQHPVITVEIIGIFIDLKILTSFGMKIGVMGAIVALILIISKQCPSRIIKIVFEMVINLLIPTVKDLSVGD